VLVPLSEGRPEERFVEAHGFGALR
jgi:hypothetical protein